MDTSECMNGEERLELYFAQYDMNLGILRMFEGLSLLDAAHIIVWSAQGSLTRRWINTEKYELIPLDYNGTIEYTPKIITQENM